MRRFLRPVSPTVLISIERNPAELRESADLEYALALELNDADSGARSQAACQDRQDSLPAFALPLTEGRLPGCWVPPLINEYDQASIKDHPQSQDAAAQGL